MDIIEQARQASVMQHTAHKLAFPLPWAVLDPLPGYGRGSATDLGLTRTSSTNVIHPIQAAPNPEGASRTSWVVVNPIHQ
jgi:hypothetical protein